MNRQCEAILDRLLEVTQDGWPRECDVRCGQTVGLGVLRDYSGEPHYFCSRHYQLVRSRRMELLIAFVGGIAAAYLFAWALCHSAAEGDRRMWADRDCTPEEALRGERNEK